MIRPSTSRSALVASVALLSLLTACGPKNNQMPPVGYTPAAERDTSEARGSGRSIEQKPPEDRTAQEPLPLLGTVRPAPPPPVEEGTPEGGSSGGGEGGDPGAEHFEGVTTESQVGPGVTEGNDDDASQGAEYEEGTGAIGLEEEEDEEDGETEEEEEEESDE